MNYIASLEDCSFRNEDQVVVAIGVFDGLHIAHRRLIEECKFRAKLRKGNSVVLTFSNHPGEVLFPERPIRILTPPKLKQQLLRSMKIDSLVSIPFDKQLSHTPALEFIDRVLCERLNAQEIVIGFNFHFGYNREGSADLIQSMVPKKFKDVVIVEQQFLDEIPVSSSYIRNCVREGNIQQAALLLGRNYTLAGTIVPGDGRGRSIGIPTANVDTQNMVLPPNGVYGVRVRIDDIDNKPFWGVMNIGTAPTFKTGGEKSVEVHILDFDKDIYDEYLIVEIIQSIRAEQIFSSPDQLVAQIHKDIETFQRSVTNHRK